MSSARPFSLRTVVVWALAALAGAGWWLLRAPADGSDGGGGEGGPRLVFADERPVFDEVRSIEIVRGGTTFRFERDRTAPVLRWVQVLPFAADIDPFSMQQIVEGVGNLARFRSASATEGDARAFGFDEPAARLEVATASGTWSLVFGARGVAGRAFVQATSSEAAPQRIDVVDTVLYERIVEMDPKEWRSRELFPESLGVPRRIEWKFADGAIIVEREGRRWKLVAPITGRADGARIEELLAAIARSRSDGVLFDQPSERGSFGLERPMAVVDVVYESPDDPTTPTTTRRVIVGHAIGLGTNDRYAMIDGTPSIVRLSAGTQGVLFPRVELLPDPVASGVRGADVKRIEIRAKDATIELVRSLDQWTVASPGAPAAPASNAAVEGFLTLLTATRAPEILLVLGGFPQDLEAATVLFFGFDDRPLDVIRVAKDAKTAKWGFENGDRVLRIHPPATQVPLDAAAFLR
jgi:hypothetical protein